MPCTVPLSWAIRITASKRNRNGQSAANPGSIAWQGVSIGRYYTERTVEPMEVAGLRAVPALLSAGLARSEDRNCNGMINGGMRC